MLCAGTIAAAVINFAGRSRKDGSRPIDPLDFVPEWKPKPRQSQTLEQQIEIMTTGFGCGPGKPKKKRK